MQVSRFGADVYEMPIRPTLNKHSDSIESMLLV